VIRPHLGRQPVEVDRHDRPRPRADRDLEPIRVDGVGRGVDVDQHEAGSRVADGGGRRDIAVRDRDHLVPRPDPQPLQDQELRRQAGLDPDHVGAAAEPRRHRLLQRRHELGAVAVDVGQEEIEGALDRGPHLPVLPGDVDQRDRHATAPSPVPTATVPPVRAAS
jgi:hypothetical protein